MIWDLNNLQYIGTLPGHRGFVKCLHASYAKKVLCSGHGKRSGCSLVILLHMSACMLCVCVCVFVCVICLYIYTCVCTRVNVAPYTFIALLTVYIYMYTFILCDSVCSSLVGT